MIKLKDEIYETYPTFDETIECSICTNEVNINTCVITECKHCFCLPCIMDHFDFQQKTTQQRPLLSAKHHSQFNSKQEVLCPMCREPIKKTRLFRTLPLSFKKVDVESDDDDELQMTTQGEISRDRDYFVRLFNPYGKSTKLNALCSHLSQIKEANPGDHVIVFSQFTSFLDIVSKELDKYKNSFEVYQFDGRLDRGQRKNVLNDFNKTASGGKISPLIDFIELAKNKASK
ncbi:unnamed protein product [Ambrosiozyma monospora]|uniref:Unnamed protein product n=1 Tax=Ambrosiozyma monospora TaxID=43982 RepID=A0ACB5UAR6_AMBMO|nr:unnamed protein product [Ambrosiozyma monospora]